MEIPNGRIAAMTDFTLLKAEATDADIEALCVTALLDCCYGVCVNSYYLPRVRVHLRGSNVKAVTVVGFPLGANMPAIKAREAGVVATHADEIDMVMNVGAFLDGHYGRVEADIADVVRAAFGKPVKVIVESAALPNAAAVATACRIAENAGANFVKTSTGFHPKGGATVDAVAAMHAAVGGRLGIKASGGMTTPDDARKMIAAGATRIGTSKASVFGG